MIKLSITKMVDNPDYEELFKEWKRQNNYGSMNLSCPSRQVLDTSMEVQITDKQFEAIRKAVLEQF